LNVIYLDHNATTPVLPEVFEATMPYFTDRWGNPSSSYRFGSELKGAIEAATGPVVDLIGSRAGEGMDKVFQRIYKGGNMIPSRMIHAIRALVGSRLEHRRTRGCVDCGTYVNQ
jgi:hypothetical protein